MSIPVAIAVYCGSRAGFDPRHHSAAVRLGQILARAGVALVYGGGSVGLMGDLADAVLAEGGTVIGVIPRFLVQREVGHPKLTELHVVETMHERKMLMFELADAYVVLPGGIGTLEELFEVMSWRVLNLHRKPIAVVDDGGYWIPLRAMIARTIDGGFAAKEHARLLNFVDSVEDILPFVASLSEADATSDISKV